VLEGLVGDLSLSIFIIKMMLFKFTIQRPCNPKLWLYKAATVTLQGKKVFMHTLEAPHVTEPTVKGIVLIVTVVFSVHKA
jgi:hypothetical protein